MVGWLSKTLIFVRSLGNFSKKREKKRSIDGWEKQYCQIQMLCDSHTLLWIGGRPSTLSYRTLCTF